MLSIFQITGIKWSFVIFILNINDRNLFAGWKVFIKSQNSNNYNTFDIYINQSQK